MIWLGNIQKEAVKLNLIVNGYYQGSQNCITYLDYKGGYWLEKKSAMYVYNYTYIFYSYFHNANC